MIFDLVESEDPKTFPKRKNQEIAKNLIALLGKNIFPKEDVKLVLYFVSLMSESDKFLPEKNLDLLTEALISFVFKHMRDVTLDEIAMSLEYLDGLDTSKAGKFLQRLQEHLTVTNPTLLKEPTVSSLITFASAFFELKMGNT
jgi:hypothetical protein